MYRIVQLHRLLQGAVDPVDCRFLQLDQGLGDVDNRDADLSNVLADPNNFSPHAPCQQPQVF